MSGVRSAGEGGGECEVVGEPVMFVNLRWTAMLIVLVPMFASAQTNGGQLLQQCELLERSMRYVGEDVKMPAEGDAHACWGFMEAMQQLTGVSEEKHRSILGDCLVVSGRKGKLTQLIRVFTNYARTHPTELNDIAVVVVMKAIQTAYPCKD